MKKIILTIAPGGELTIETTGFKGKACEAATKAMEEALGVKTKSVKKPEYFQQTTGHQSIGGSN